MAPTDTYLGLRAFVDELFRCGLRWACTSPGSRSTPMVLSLARDRRIQTISHIDERSSGFFGLGVGKATGVPAALVCTSGTAAANFAPAVIEAFEARTPLIVLTTDRPPELRAVGAGQTIDQTKLFGSAVKWYLEVDEHDATAARMRWLRQLACRVFWTTVNGRPGPVHLNFSFREPLILDTPLSIEEPGGGGRRDGRPWITVTGTESTVDQSQLKELESLLKSAVRPILVAGRYEREPEFGATVASFASTFGIPLLAEPLSGARRGPTAIAHYDALLRDTDWTQGVTPDLVIRIGDLPTSKPLRQWLNGTDLEDVHQITIDAEASWQDPSACVTQIVNLNPHAALTHIIKNYNADSSTLLGGQPTAARHDFLCRWIDADRVAGKAIGEVLEHEDSLTEPWIATALGECLTEDAILFVASSMPIRDVETFLPTCSNPPQVLSNRGANGIDGTIATAFGVAASTDRHVVLLIGDVALAHDVGSLINSSRLGAKISIVLINNDGGGIFHFLPAAREGQDFIDHIATPHGLDFDAIAKAAGCIYNQVDDKPGFIDALKVACEAASTTVIEVQTVREENVDLHRRIWRGVKEALEAPALSDTFKGFPETANV